MSPGQDNIFRHIEPNKKHLTMDILTICAQGTGQQLAKFSRRDVLSAEDEHGNSALHIAARNPDVSCLEFLTNFQGGKRRLRVTNKHGEGPFHIAARSNNVQSIEILQREKLSNIDEQSNTGETPLAIALSEKNIEAAHCLLRLGSNPLLEDNSQTPPLAHILDQSPVDKTLRELVVNAGFALELATVTAQEGTVCVLQPLLEHPSVSDREHLLLQEALIRGNTTVACALIDRGLVNLVFESDNSSPLVLAIMYGRTKVADKLVKKGAQDVCDKNDRNAVIAAVETNDVELVKLLLFHGFASVSETRKATQTAIDMDHTNCLVELLRSGEPVFGLDMTMCLSRNVSLLAAAGWSQNDEADTSETSSCSDVLSPMRLTFLSSTAFRNAVNRKKTNILHVVAKLNVPARIQKFLLLGNSIQCFQTQ